MLTRPALRPTLAQVKRKKVSLVQVYQWDQVLFPENQTSESKGLQLKLVFHDHNLFLLHRRQIGHL